METFDKLKKAIEGLDESGDVTKFANGEKGATQAGARVRKVLQDVKNLSQALRVEIQDTVNARKTAK